MRAALPLAILGLAWGLARPSEAAITRGPYIQLTTPTSAVVRWRSNPGTDSRVRWGTELTNLAHPGGYPNAVDDPAIVTEHEISIEGLTPDTRYYYSVGSTAAPEAGGDANHWIETAPVEGTDAPVRVWIIGDSGTGNQYARHVRDAYLAYPGADDTDVWLMLGDNAYNSGTDGQYQAAVFDTYSSLLRNTTVWPTRGNHDGVFSGPDNDIFDFFTMPTNGEAGGVPSGDEAYYSFNHANVHFICLDSQGSDGSPNGAMLTWLAADLAANTQDWTIAYWHHPPYTKGTHDSDNPGDSGGRMRTMRQNALPVLEAAGVDLVLSGHSHGYERSYLIDGHYGVSSTFDESMKVDGGDGDPLGDGPYQKAAAGPTSHSGTVYNVTGCSGAGLGGTFTHPVMVRGMAVFGSLILDVQGNRLDAVFLDAGGAERDHFSIEKGVGVDPTTVPIAAQGDLTLRVSPNPFASETTLEFALPGAGAARVRVFDVSGREVASLVERDLDAGSHRARWDGRTSRGGRAAPGVYYGVVEFGGELRTKKLVRVN